VVVTGNQYINPDLKFILFLSTILVVLLFGVLKNHKLDDKTMERLSISEYCLLETEPESKNGETKIVKKFLEIRTNSFSDLKFNFFEKNLKNDLHLSIFRKVFTPPPEKIWIS
jgi:hypothetical protein